VLIPYVRRSRSDEESISIGDQLHSIMDWGRRNEVELAEPVVEKGVSGHASWRERELGEVIARCQRGEADGVIVSYRSRLSREKASASMEVLEELEAYRLVIVKSGRDAGPGEDKTSLIDTIESWQARDEWKTLGRHLKGGKHFVWEQGAYVNSTIPAGYDGEPLRNAKGEAKGAMRLIPNEHLPTIGHAITIKANGGSWGEVARALRGVPTTKGSLKWSNQAVRGLAQNQIYMGVMTCTCCGKTRNMPELAAVTPSVWKRAQPKPGVKTGTNRGKSLLAGMLRCGGCGYTMSYGTTVVDGKRYAFYRCRGGELCDNRASVSAPKVEAILKDRVLEWFQTQTPALGHESDVATLTKLEHTRDHAIEKLQGLVALLEPSDPGAGARLVEAREAVREAEIALLGATSARREYLSPEQVRKIFELAPVEDQRLVLRAYIDKITVAPGRAPIAERIATPLPPLPTTRYT
jgi:site-specific DNA recombinase